MHNKYAGSQDEIYLWISHLCFLKHAMTCHQTKIPFISVETLLLGDILKNTWSELILVTTWFKFAIYSANDRKVTVGFFHLQHCVMVGRCVYLIWWWSDDSWKLVQFHKLFIISSLDQLHNIMWRLQVRHPHRFYSMWMNWNQVSSIFQVHFWPFII